MWKAALVSAFALATVGASSLCAQELRAQELRQEQLRQEQRGENGGEIRQAAQSLIVLTRNDIARFKTALKLSPMQEQYWPPVSAALTELAAEQAADSEAAGMFTRIRNRVAAVALTATAMRRIGQAALPLIKSLDENQKRDAVKLVNSMGMGHLAAAF